MVTVRYALTDLLPTETCHFLNDDMSPDMVTPLALAGQIVTPSIAREFKRDVATMKFDSVFCDEYRNKVYTVHNANGSISCRVRL